MNFKFLDKKDSRGIVNNLFSISFTKEDLPFKTIIIPIGLPSLVYIFSKNQTVLFNKKITPLQGLTVSGQFSSTYHYHVNDESYNVGINLHPTALYKILQIDISTLTNRLVPLIEIDKDLFKRMNPFFLNYKQDPSSFITNIIAFIESLELIDDKDVKHIDKAIAYIDKNEGMINVLDLLKILPFSQKSLETKFKKIIGITPGKFIRLSRFTKLMRKYEDKKLSLKDLIHKYNYYDHSHFLKDFKLFMPESPKSYFKNEYPLIKSYSKDL
ncbi:helix-turn-helix domain-containing protein [Polaribacter butkevichii]|uniref:HTH araC/xylS-type domain-containing protein n=1 Tax=Polaribacter butkevichii TaxID=218490 RepID=A0A2P6CEK7_9FLAO|nr:helix-turn-helix domain-containing protein [Polaribacter butkevichii]PQJ73343.1 hypothetical protein BTO14_08740 [Polaribacter butkevichii]